MIESRQKIRYVMKHDISLQHVFQIGNTDNKHFLPTAYFLPMNADNSKIRIPDAILSTLSWNKNSYEYSGHSAFAWAPSKLFCNRTLRTDGAHDFASKEI